MLEQTRPWGRHPLGPLGLIPPQSVILPSINQERTLGDREQWPIHSKSASSGPEALPAHTCPPTWNVPIGCNSTPFATSLSLSAQELAGKAGIDAGAIYLDMDKMLREADIDAVDICTTHNAHAPLAIAAAEAGKHVICEKPMAISVQECRDMIAAADRAGVTLMVAQHLRYAPEAQAAKRLLDEGKLGTIEAVRTELFGGGMRGRRRRRRQGERWMQDARRSGGGMMMSEQVHHIDLLRYYAGNVKRVSGVCKSLQEHMVNGAEDLVSATLEFESGAVGEVWAKGNAIVPHGRTYTILGDRGVFLRKHTDEGAAASRNGRRHAVSAFRPHHGCAERGPSRTRSEQP